MQTVSSIADTTMGGLDHRLGHLTSKSKEPRNIHIVGMDVPENTVSFTDDFFFTCKISILADLISLWTWI